MMHPPQEDLVLFYYGERDDVAVHLRECEACRHDYQSLQRTLNAVDSLPVPERPEDYASIIWKRVAPKLPARPRRSFWWAVPKWAMAAALVIGAFLIGRSMQRPVMSPLASQANRTLLVAVGDHLDRSQMVLAEIVNAGDPGKGQLDISYEQKIAEDLVDNNRLYRTSADSAGDRATASLLDDLERVLIEITHTPSSVSGQQFEELKRRIEDQGLMFKVRVFQNRIQEKDKTI